MTSPRESYSPKNNKVIHLPIRSGFIGFKSKHLPPRHTIDSLNKRFVDAQSISGLKALINEAQGIGQYYDYDMESFIQICDFKIERLSLKGSKGYE